MGKEKLEPFEPDESLLSELEELNGVKKKVKKKAKKSVNFGSPDLNQLVGINKPRGAKSKTERSREVSVKLERLGIDPLEEILEMLQNPEVHGLDGKEVLRGYQDLLGYISSKKKSVEIKEDKNWKIEVVKKDFKLGDDGEVLEIE